MNRIIFALPLVALVTACGQQSSQESGSGASGQIRVVISLVDQPRIDPFGFPMVLAVPSLFEAEKKLSDSGVGFEWAQAIDWADRRLAVLDPAGNRVVLKQEWPFGTI